MRVELGGGTKPWSQWVWLLIFETSMIALVLLIILYTRCSCLALGGVGGALAG